MNATYRSIFSGPEIDEAIASMKATAGLIIVNNFEGGVTKIASAELAKILHQNIEKIKDPDYMKTLIDAIPSGRLFNKDDQAKFNYLNSSFRGVFSTINMRDSATFEESKTYKGNELCLVLNNGDGVAEIQTWDTVTSKWVRAKMFGAGEIAPTLVATATTLPIQQFNRLRYGSMKCIISATNTAKTQKQVQEVLVTAIGTDTYISIYGDVGNANLFNLTSTLTGDLVELNITTLAPNLTITGKQLALF